MYLVKTSEVAPRDRASHLSGQPDVNVVAALIAELQAPVDKLVALDAARGGFQARLSSAGRPSDERLRIETVQPTDARGAAFERRVVVRGVTGPVLLAGRLEVEVNHLVGHQGRGVANRTR